MSLFDIVDKNLSLSAEMETINNLEGVKERYTLTAEVDHLTQEDITNKILAMLQSDTHVETILQTIKGEIQKETIPTLSTVEERNAEVRRIRDEKLNAWAKEIQEKNQEMRLLEEESEYELAESESEEEIEYQYVIQPENSDTQTLSVRGTLVYLNGVPVERDELLRILSYPPRKLDRWDTELSEAQSSENPFGFSDPQAKWDWLLVGSAAIGVLGFSLWLSLLSCSLWKMNHQ